MDYMKLTIDDIIKWCQENNQVAWLKATAAETVPCKIYPRKQIIKKVLNKETNEYEDTLVSVADKSAAPTIEERPITFVQLKKKFRDTFLANEMPKKPKKPTMYEIIANL